MTVSTLRCNAYRNWTHTVFELLQIKGILQSPFVNDTRIFDECKYEFNGR
jgi:hypothetical protein